MTAFSTQPLPQLATNSKPTSDVDSVRSTPERLAKLISNRKKFTRFKNLSKQYLELLLLLASGPLFLSGVALYANKDQLKLSELKNASSQAVAYATFVEAKKSISGVFFEAPKPGVRLEHDPDSRHFRYIGQKYEVKGYDLICYDEKTKCAIELKDYSEEPNLFNIKIYGNSSVRIKLSEDNYVVVDPQSLGPSATVNFKPNAKYFDINSNSDSKLYQFKLKNTQTQQSKDILYTVEKIEVGSNRYGMFCLALLLSMASLAAAFKMKKHHQKTNHKHLYDELIEITNKNKDGLTSTLELDKNLKEILDRLYPSLIDTTLKTNQLNRHQTAIFFKHLEESLLGRHFRDSNMPSLADAEEARRRLYTPEFLCAYNDKMINFVKDMQLQMNKNLTNPSDLQYFKSKNLSLLMSYSVLQDKSEFSKIQDFLKSQQVNYFSGHQKFTSDLVQSILPQLNKELNKELSNAKRIDLDDQQGHLSNPVGSRITEVMDNLTCLVKDYHYPIAHNHHLLHHLYALPVKTQAEEQWVEELKKIMWGAYTALDITQYQQNVMPEFIDNKSLLILSDVFLNEPRNKKQSSLSKQQKEMLEIELSKQLLSASIQATTAPHQKRVSKI